MDFSLKALRLSRPRFSKGVPLLLSSLLVLGTAGCGSPFESDPSDDTIDAGSDTGHASTLARVEVTPSTASVVERRTVQLSAKGFDEDDAEIAALGFSFASSDENVAIVDAAGLVTAVKPGKVTITAAASGKSASATITITEAAAASLAVTIDRTEIPVDGSLALVVTVKDEEGVELLGRAIAFTSEDESKASVDAKGNVSGVAPGETKIVAKIAGLEEKVDVRVVHRFEKIFAGAYHNCGLTSVGRAWCWGSNVSGALGNGDEDGNDRPSPVPLVIDSGIAFQTLALGEDFGCGLTNDEKVWCWGGNHVRQLGRDSSLSSSAIPLPLDDRSYEALSAMSYGACGLDGSGLASCWGYSTSFHELGNSEVTESSATPVAVSAPIGQAGPVAFSELHHGRYHSCGLAKDGKAYCWGNNWYGQLGNGTKSASPAPFEPLAGTTVTLLGTGAFYSCAVSSQKRTYCWGANGHKQVEEEGGADSPLPAQRFDETVFVPASFALGDGHGCALDAGGRAWCWGSNGEGQLGRSTTPPSTARGEVEGGHRFTSLVSGVDHLCGLATDSKVYCWGSNNNGQIGAGTFDARFFRPTPIAGQ